jgi:hypothetical protein
VTFAGDDASRHDAVLAAERVFAGPRRPSPMPRFFPVDDAAFRMRAGLLRFPTDLGNGVADERAFVADPQWAEYVAAKHTPGPTGAVPILRTALSQEAEDAAVLAAAWSWLCAQVERDVAPLAPTVAPLDPREPAAWRSLMGALQEDIVVVRRLPSGGDRVVAQSVSFPAGWRPERIVGAPFSAIHAPVPEFASDARASASMIAAMVERGPYVRFVWTISPDASLDHHPDEGQLGAWATAAPRQVRFRMERQISIPLREVDAAVFVIRTLQRSIDELDAAQRARIAAAIGSMSPAVRGYKGFSGHEARIAAALRVAVDGA